ncbi:UNVERIFIED_CONTAM: hypothetical protein FKN15_062784 [Acipenser sinensis]
MDNCSCRSEYELCADRPRDAGSNLYAEKAPVTECVDRYYLYKLVNSRAAGMRCSGLQKGRTIRMDKTDCVFSSRVTIGSTGAGSRGRWGAFIIDNEDSSDLNVLSGGTCQYQAKAGDVDMDCKASYCYQRSGQIKRRLNLASKETTGDQSADKNTAKEFGQPAHRSFSVQNRRRKFTLSVWSWWAFLVFHTHVLKAAAQGSAHRYHPCADSGGAKMNTRCPPKCVPSAARFFTLCRLTVQPPQSYSVGGQRSSGQLTGKPAGARPDYRGRWCAVSRGHPGRPNPPSPRTTLSQLSAAPWELLSTVGCGIAWT